MLLRSLSILALNRCVNTRWVCICFFYFSPVFYRIFCMKSDILFVTIKEISMTQREELEKMQEILRDKIENTIPDYSTNGKCSRCGRCCSNLLSMTMNYHTWYVVPMWYPCDVLFSYKEGYYHRDFDSCGL